MFRAPDDRKSVRTRLLLLLTVGCLMSHGCATQTTIAVPRMDLADCSPVAEEVAPMDAWRLAEAYAASHPGCETLVGSGASMMPFYRDRTVLVVQAMKMSELKVGMTVVFVGDKGRPVAHTLIARTPRGWQAKGLGNTEPDRTLVRAGNYIGTVIKAYAPSASLAAAGDPASARVDVGNVLAKSVGPAWTGAFFAAGDQ